jgi:copper chaperone CopZ
VSRAIESVHGVTKVTVDFEKSEAQVEGQDCDATMYQAIARSLQADGYGGTVTKVGPMTPPVTSSSAKP